MQVTCYKCGQTLKSELRMPRHEKVCLATGKWIKKSNFKSASKKRTSQGYDNTVSSDDTQGMVHYRD